MFDFQENCITTVALTLTVPNLALKLLKVFQNKN